MSDVLRLYYVGEHFYHRSSTMMSSIYTEGGKRSDWGKVQVHLGGGGTIEIRQATAREMADAYRMLAEIQESHATAKAGPQ